MRTWLSTALDATKQQASTESSDVSPAPVSTPSIDSSSSVSTQGENPSKVPPQQIAAPTSSPPTALVQASPASGIGTPTQLHPTLQKAIIVCALMFIYTMYRVCAAMDQMQALTRESLIQQRQQQELLKELLEMLGSRR